MKIDVDIPDQESGNWKIQTFEVSEDQAEIFNIRQVFNNHGYGDRSIVSGKYKRLLHNGHTIMSNTPAEIQDLKGFIRIATGNILINGLGLGVCLKAILEKSEVDQVTIIELSMDVISMVEPYFINNRCGKKIKDIIHADALEFKPPKGMIYDCVWHDIWPDISSDNIPPMSKLHRKYGKKSKWQDSWCRWQVKRMQREDRDYNRVMNLINGNI